MFRLKIVVSLHALAFSSRALANRWLRVCGKATGWLSSPSPLWVSWRSPKKALLLVSALWPPLHVPSPRQVESMWRMDLLVEFAVSPSG